MVRKTTDYEELFECFGRHRVNYLVIGAHAVAYFARPRYTKDLDIFVEPTEANARRVLAALEEFGFGGLGLSVEDFSEVGRIVELGMAPNRIDIVTSIDGVTFAEAWPARVEGGYGEARVHYMSREHLVQNKRASGRPQDLLDLQALGDD